MYVVMWDCMRGGREGDGNNPSSKPFDKHNKVLRSYFAQRGGMRRNGRSRHDGNGREHVGFDVYM
jgi:hypothetical protein